MTYIRDLDPQWTDPKLDQPWHCPWCGLTCTVEDTTQVHAIEDPEVTGTLCPHCGDVVWDKRPE